MIVGYTDGSKTVHEVYSVHVHLRTFTLGTLAQQKITHITIEYQTQSQRCLAASVSYLPLLAHWHPYPAS